MKLPSASHPLMRQKVLDKTFLFRLIRCGARVSPKISHSGIEEVDAHGERLSGRLASSYLQKAALVLRRKSKL